MFNHKKFDSGVRKTPQSQNFRLCKSKFFLFKFFLSWYVFTPKRISPDCPFKSNQRLSKVSILTPRCAFWLCCMMHTSELFKNSNISAKSKILHPVYQGPRWVRLMNKNGGRKSRDTLPLSGHNNFLLPH